MFKTQITSLKKLANSMRILSADAVEYASSGHPGMPLGFADVFALLVSNYLRYNPEDPEWHARDRLILSAGHGSMLLYSFFHLVGYKDYTMMQIKHFRKIGSITPGHPEYSKAHGIEVTTGPLGQGFANSVGIAIAQKKYEHRLGKLMDYKVYCICGDGCLMEGISFEAASLAGHLGLNNLIVLFDDNHITIDGSTTLSTSDDHLERFKALGWEVYQADGHDFEQIDHVLSKAQTSLSPCFISLRTKIGYGSGEKEGSSESHGAPLGSKFIEELRKSLDWEKPPFEIPDDIYHLWKVVRLQKLELYNSWQDQFKSASPEEKEYLKMPAFEALKEQIAQYMHHDHIEPEATRHSSTKVLEILQKASNKIIAGSADLASSSGILNKYSKPITKHDFSGNFINYGVRENAMASIMNGLATQNFIALGSSFLVFSDYMRPGIRLSAIMKLPVIYIFSHDSIGVGEDGPTHQPIEHLASLRSIPNLMVYRPADREEVTHCYDAILSHSCSPSVMALSRQKLPQYKFYIDRKLFAHRGAYFLSSPEHKVDVTIWASGSEVHLSVTLSTLLQSAGLSSRIISCPNIELFFAQDKKYQNMLLDPDCVKSEFTCAIEAGISLGWERITRDNGIFFGLNDFGISGPCEEVYSYFKLTASSIANKIINHLKK